MTIHIKDLVGKSGLILFGELAGVDMADKGLLMPTSKENTYKLVFGEFECKYFPHFDDLTIWQERDPSTGRHPVMSNKVVVLTDDGLYYDELKY